MFLPPIVKHEIWESYWKCTTFTELMQNMDGNTELWLIIAICKLWRKVISLVFNTVFKAYYFSRYCIKFDATFWISMLMLKLPQNLQNPNGFHCKKSELNMIVYLVKSAIVLLQRVKKAFIHWVTFNFLEDCSRIKCFADLHNPPQRILKSYKKDNLKLL